MKTPYLALALGALVAGAALAKAPVKPDDAKFQAKLDAALAGEHRSDAHKARDKYRHPKETLGFFGLKSGQRVIEIWPGGGWYTEVLAPLMKGEGKLIVAVQDPADPTLPKFEVKMVGDYKAMLAAKPELYGEVEQVTFNPPKQLELGPPGSADVVLTFRNVHNWVEAKGAAEAFQAFYKVLKPGGILGVTDHRAAAGKKMEETFESGYLPEDAVIKLATDAGFELAGKSEINANPTDTKDYPKGVWTLPPTYALKDKDREKYAAIGESDRMTLKFVKKK
jgi:predicted methyltransferase